MKPQFTGVKYLTLTDALGRKKPGWYVIYLNDFCGCCATQEEAERQLKALMQIRKVGQ